MSAKRHATLRQQMTIVNGIVVLLVLIVIFKAPFNAVPSKNLELITNGVCIECKKCVGYLEG